MGFNPRRPPPIHHHCLHAAVVGPHAQCPPWLYEPVSASCPQLQCAILEIFPGSVARGISVVLDIPLPVREPQLLSDN